jgi:DNA repair photolyase
MERKSNGHMYEFINDTWNPIKGECPHKCAYCYMKAKGKQGTLRIDNSEFLKRLGKGNYIFIGSSTDVFADIIPSYWITAILNFCNYYNDPEKPNTFLLQSKNPKRFLEFTNHPLMKHVKFCTTIETNRFYPDIMNNAPRIEEREEAMERIAEQGFSTMVTAEPLMDFDIEDMISIIKRCNPEQVNIGKESIRKVPLPEPSPEKVRDLIASLSEFTRVKIKSNANIWVK